MDTNLLAYCVTERQRQTIEQIIKSGSNGKAARDLGVDIRSVDRTLARVKRQAATAGYVAQSAQPSLTTIDSDKKTFIITSAVNDSRVFKAGLRSINAFLKENNAQLLVIPLRYKNPTSIGEAKAVYTWAAPILSHLIDRRVKLCDGLQLLADIKTQPTAVRPLTSLDTITGTDCGIVGHTRVAMDSVPTRGHDLPKLMWTTGAITLPSYSDTTAGKKGEFHHVLGALVVEIDGSRFHVRNISLRKDGSFIDLDKMYSGDKVKKAPPAAAIRCGDIHMLEADKNVMRTTFGKGGIVDRLQPRFVIVDDVLDFGSASHHLSYWEKFRRHHDKSNSIERELAITCAGIDSMYRPFSKTVIVASNHHEHLMRWLEKSENGNDLENAILYHEVKAEILTAIKNKGRIPSAFELVANRRLKHPAIFLSRSDSFVVKNIENAYHGDRGPGGSRGSIQSFSKIGIRVNIGHSHRPGIMDGAYQTGTSGPTSPAYAAGDPSGSLHSHVVTYDNGARTHLHIIDGRYCRDRSEKK